MALEARVDRLEAALLRLAEAQARAEERFVRLEDAQARTEESMRQLAAAQARTEVRMEELAAAQARMAAAQERTELAVQSLAQQVGRLADTIGFTLEELAREVTPAYLAQHYNIHTLQLDRSFIVVDGQELEFDLYGHGQRNGERVTVVGEVRSRIYGRDVEEAVRRTTRLTPQLSGTLVKVLFGFVIHPLARVAAQRLGAIVISSSGR